MIITKAHYLLEDHRQIGSTGVYVDHAHIYDYFQKHVHDFNELFIIVSGSARHMLGDGEYPLGRGDVVVIKGGMAHGFSAVADLDIINLMYDPRVFEQRAYELQTIPGFVPLFLIEPEVRSHSGYTSVLKLDEASLKYVVAVVDFMKAQQESADAARGAVIRLNFLALVAFLAARYGDTGGESERMRTLARVINYMDVNMDKPLKLRDMADCAHLSPRQLERLFGAMCAETPMRYLQDMRLRRAVSLLVQRGETVANAAAQCGFADPAYFTRVFRDAYGITPMDAKSLLVGMGCGDQAEEGFRDRA